jgi:hypothetical protein
LQSVAWPASITSCTAETSGVRTSSTRFAASPRLLRFEETLIPATGPSPTPTPNSFALREGRSTSCTDLKTLQINPVERGIDVVISGHSHVPKVDTVDGVLYLNPGSAGPRRFRRPIALATIDVTPDGLRTVNHDLGDG